MLDNGFLIKEDLLTLWIYLLWIPCHLIFCDLCMTQTTDEDAYAKLLESRLNMLKAIQHINMHRPCHILLHYNSIAFILREILMTVLWVLNEKETLSAFFKLVILV